ncbi:hypothetical protein EBT16_12125, partial [bacterium]|nr:hypothetical protein [bacterium]
MRLVNEQNDNQTNLEPVGFLSLLFYSLLCGLGFSSFLMSPFAVILVHRRLPDFWPKVVSIAGAVLALVVLEVPLPIVVFSFVLSVFVADNVHRQVPVWSLIFRTAVLVSFLGLLGLGIASRSFHLSDLVSVWTQFVDQVVKQAQESQLLIPEWDISTVRRLLFYQGPFYFVSGCL